MRVRMKRIFCLLLVFSCCLIPLSPIAAKKKVKLNYARLTMKKGTTKKLRLLRAKGKIEWKSSSKKVVKVKPNGKIQAKKVGTATISAKYKSKKYRCRIKVVSTSAQYTADRFTVNNNIFTKEKYQNLKKMKIGNHPKDIEITNEKDRYTIYSMLAEAKYEPLPKDTEPLNGSWGLIFEMQDGTKFEVALNKYLAYGGTLYSTPDGLVNRVHRVLEKYLKR